MYSIKQVFKQEPAAIVAVLMGWLMVAVVAGWVTMSSATLQAVNSAGVGTLLLAYVRPLTSSRDGLQQVHDAQLQAIDLGKQLGPDPAPPAVPPQGG